MQRLILAAFLLLAPVLAYGQQAAPSSPTISLPGPISAESLLVMMNERDRQYQQRFADIEKFQTLVAEAAEKAVSTANTANEKRLDSVNEFRGQLRDQTATLLPRAEADARFTNLEKDLANLRLNFENSMGRAQGAQWLYSVLGVLLGTLIGLAMLVVSIRKDAARKI